MTVQANKPFSGSQWSEVESLPADHVKVALIERIDG